jgi:hypothetical protein
MERIDGAWTYLLRKEDVVVIVGTYTHVWM